MNGETEACPPRSGFEAAQAMYDRVRLTPRRRIRRSGLSAPPCHLRASTMFNAPTGALQPAFQDRCAAHKAER